MHDKPKTKIVVVGGGAGGLELVARLVRSRLKSVIELTLVDNKLKHIWKPLLHEVAVGTISYEDEVDYIAYASLHGFHFQYGTLSCINRAKKEVVVQTLVNDVNVTPLRIIPYDILVLAIGSISNDYGIEGIHEHCLFLDNLQEAENLHALLTKKILTALNGDLSEKFTIAIIGGGATGVELAAELTYAFAEVDKIKPNALPYQINIVESANRILPNMPERISRMAAQYLKGIHINLLTDKRITRVEAKGLQTKSGEFIAADLIIWSAGIKAEAITHELDGLEVNALNQLMVKPTLQTTKDNAIFAFGDCASCLQIDKGGREYYVPPRAQAAHQQAKFLVNALKRYIHHQPLLNYEYKDYGSLITISKYNIVGNLMSRVAKNLYIEGKLARLSYWWLYKNHQIQLHGLWRVLILTLANGLAKKLRPKLKLH